MRQSVVVWIIISSLEKNIQRKTYSCKKSGFYRWPWVAWSSGLGWGWWAGRARPAGWLYCHAGGGVGYGFSWIRDVSEYSGQRIFCIFVISRAENIGDQSNAEKTLWWDDGRTLSSLPMDFHSGFPVHDWSRRILCVLLCDMCGCLPAGGPCLQEPVLGWGCRELEARGSTKIADVSFITFSGLSLYLVVRAESATWSNF